MQPEKPKKTILFVEDDPKHLQAVSAALTGRGFEVWPMTDGKRAIALFQVQRPDVVIVDLILPGCGGFAVLKTIADAQDVATPVIVLTNVEIPILLPSLWR